MCVCGREGGGGKSRMMHSIRNMPMDRCLFVCLLVGCVHAYSILYIHCLVLYCTHMEKFIISVITTFLFLMNSCKIAIFYTDYGSNGLPRG